MTEELLLIGQFSQRCRLSPKALRLYDELGLVQPVRVDPANGYRWYAADQVGRARLVGLLRQLDLPLATIAELVELPGSAAAMAVRAHVATTTATARARADLGDYLCHLLEQPELTMPEPDPIEATSTDPIGLRTLPARAVLSGVRHAHTAQAGAVLGELLGRMRQSGPGLPGIEGCPYLIYYAEVSDDSDGPVEVVRPAADLEHAQQAAAALGDVQARIEPAHDEAFVRLPMRRATGPAVLAVLDALERFVRASGRAPAGPPRQVMIADWRTAGPDEPACDLAIPLA